MWSGPSRTAASGAGLSVMLDLDTYDYTPGAKTPVRSSEGTILSRLPARIDVRRRAALELPHIMALINDRDCRVIEPLADMKGRLEQVYSFELMEDGGTINGWRLDREAANGRDCSFNRVGRRRRARKSSSATATIRWRRPRAFGMS